MAEALHQEFAVLVDGGRRHVCATYAEAAAAARVTPGARMMRRTVGDWRWTV